MALYKTLVKKVSISPEKKTKQKDYLPKGQLPIIDQGQQLIGGYSDNLDLQLSCNLPVIVFGDHTRAVKYVDFPFGAGADGIKVLEPAEGIYPKFLYYATQYLVLRLEDRGYARHYQYIEKKKLDIPSIPEQKRIVAKIEELFSELDNGVETLRKTKQQLAVYRQAVLKDVFDSVAGCETGTIQSVCSNVVDCPHSTPSWVDNGKICLRTTNFKRGYLDLSEKNYVSNETFDKRNIRLIPQPGDVLYSREGAILGIACIIPKDLYVCLGQRMMLLRTNEKMLGRFLMHYLNSPKVTSFVSTKIGGSASPHVNVGDIKEFIVPIPSIAEQQKMLEQIESRLSVCDSIEKTVDAALQQAEAMRQSILKQGFEGKL
jgi:type I restriction enzyme S subunit